MLRRLSARLSREKKASKAKRISESLGVAVPYRDITVVDPSVDDDEVFVSASIDVNSNQKSVRESFDSGVQLTCEPPLSNGNEPGNQSAESQGISRSVSANRLHIEDVDFASAILAGDVDAVRKALKRGADVNSLSEVS